MRLCAAEQKKSSSVARRRLGSGGRIKVVGQARMTPGRALGVQGYVLVKTYPALPLGFHLSSPRYGKVFSVATYDYLDVGS